MSANATMVAGFVLLSVGVAFAGGGLWAWRQHGRPMPLNRNSMFFWRGVFLGGLLLAMGLYYLAASLVDGDRDDEAGVSLAVDNRCQVDVDARIAPESSTSESGAAGYVRIESGSVGRLATDLASLADVVVEVRAAGPTGAPITTPASEVIRLDGDLCPAP